MPYTITNQAYSTLGNIARHNTAMSTESRTQDLVGHELLDNGAGTFGPWMGVVNYVAKTLSVRVVQNDAKTDSYNSDYEDAAIFAELTGGGSSGGGGSDSQKGGVYSSAKIESETLAGGSIYVFYNTGVEPETAHTQTFTPDILSIDLCPLTSDYIVPGSVQFTWMGHVYRDFEGVIYRDRTDSVAGIASGNIDYASGIAQMYDWVVSGSPDSFTLDSLWTTRQKWKTATIMMRTQSAPLAPGGFVMVLTDTQGNALTATADNDGDLVGTHLLGKVDFLTGVVNLQFGDFVLDSSLTAAQKLEWWYNAADVGAVEALKIWRPWPVDPTTLRYNSVSYFYLPVEAEILGLDPVRLPADGRVPIFRNGGQMVLGNVTTMSEATYSNGQTIDTGTDRLSRVRIFGDDDVVITSGYTVNLDTGFVTIVDVTGCDQPARIEFRKEQMVRIADVQIDGTIKIVGQLAHDFPIGSVVSSALLIGDMKARVSAMWDQQTWNLQWANGIVGDPALANYNAALYPIEVNNAGTLTQRFALRFTSSSSFDCIGEFVGNIGSGTINADFSPINPLVPGGTTPYFTIRENGWGAGWIPGNVQFIHFEGAMAAFAQIRTVQMGPPGGIDYDYEVIGRGSVDREPTTP